MRIRRKFKMAGAQGARRGEIQETNSARGRGQVTEWGKEFGFY